MHILIPTLIIALTIDLLMFIPTYLRKTDKLTDVSYALTFIIVSLYALLKTGITLLALILVTMISIWAIRLEGYLSIRIKKIKKDKRFYGIREIWRKFLQFWLLQGVSVWAILIPSTFFWKQSRRCTAHSLVWGSYLLKEI